MQNDMEESHKNTQRKMLDILQYDSIYIKF